ncbi:hypothetical protein LSTR_LSTR001086 [Laodelphax striatellus]|uniref:VPS37 C-terminal domain-containing protein n=1 Tax=Laodelphax striatellus TaxID=195883 RepID=A0A482X132_LAOST|nr:hypothetical protein LSTR_LSTR001086 [Laodelphax striatellus]
MFQNEDDFLRPYLDKAAKLFSYLSNEDLKKVLNDDISLHSLVGDIEELIEIEDRKNSLLIAIKSSAECNLSKESCVVDNLESIIKLNLFGQTLMESVEGKVRQIASLEAVLSGLKTAINNVEKESDDVAENFLNGSIDADVFLKNFLSTRIVMHLRKFKFDKLSELIYLRRGI